MGVYSTVAITREDAIKEITRHLDGVTDRELADMLFSMFREHTLHNYWIVPSYEGCDMPTYNSWMFKRGTNAESTSSH